MRLIAANFKAKMSAAKTRADQLTLLASKPDVMTLCEIGGMVRALMLRRGFKAAGMSMWASIPEPIAWRSDWELLAKGKHHLSDATNVGPGGAGPARLRKKDAPWVLLHDPTGDVHFVINAHLAPQPSLNGKRGRLHSQQVDALAAKIAAVRTENPLAVIHVLGDLNTPDRDRLAPITDQGIQFGTVTNDLHGHQLIYIGSDWAGTRRLRGGLNTDHDAVVADVKRSGPVAKRGFMPGAIDKEIKPGANDPAITPVGGVLHVAVSEADSLHDFFDGPSGGIESHFYVRYDGTIEQYRSIYFEADANYKGNSFMRGGKLCGLLSIENEGLGAGKWTPEQIASMKNIILWAHAEADVPIQVIKAWDGDGWGYHTMFGAPGPWTPAAGKTCPGPDRIKQYRDIFVPWLRRGGLDPQPVTHTTKGRALVEQGLAELDLAKETRKAVHAMAATIQAALDAGPKA
jgi:hypothetical protein